MEIIENGLAGDRPHPELYPSLHHFRIIADAGNVPWDELRLLLSEREIAHPLAISNRSGGGKYVSLQVGVILKSREELERLQFEIRAVEGVRILL